jgi:hypothetical protein
MKINKLSCIAQKSFFLIFYLLLINISIAADVKALEPGAQAPDFSLKGVDGKVYTLKSFAGAKILAIIFTCNHCPTAQAYEDRMKSLTADYKAKGVTVVAVSPNYPKAVALDEMGYTDLGDSFEEMKLRAKHKGYNFPYLYDGDTEKMSRAYGPRPHHTFSFLTSSVNFNIRAGSTDQRNQVLQTQKMPAMLLMNSLQENLLHLLKPKLLAAA